ncbi:hypothetical protein MKX08_009474 [Trichoderma sp. CBMAI-0020]|nr:hypothetical protein MKX08_009474 [Trichoderma sp. CBMAI-0020]WOD46194.1 hypothetical protein [Trichoderma atroviride]
MSGQVKLCKIVVLGDGGVGKTAMIIQVALKRFSITYDPTIEDCYRKRDIIDSQPCILDILDTAGQEEYKALRAQWIRDADLFMVVYSISRRASFSRCQKFVSQIRSVKQSTINSADLGNQDTVTPICLVGNMSDQVTDREVSTQEGIALSRELGCDIFYECSAKTGYNIEKAFYDLVRVYWRKQHESRLEDKSSFYSTRQSLWRKKLLIPPDESESEAGRLRLTKSLVNSAKANHERETLALLEAGAQVNGQPGSDGAAIHAAAAAGHTNIINILLKNRAAIDATGPAGTSALQVAAVEGHLAVVKLLIHKGAQINKTSKLHGTALSAAASRGRLSVIEFLLKKKADVNIDGGPFGNALQAAAWVGKVPIVEALLNAGADINARGEGNCTALQVAAFAGHARVIRTLLSRGATIYIDDSSGKYGCALKAADDHGHFEAVKILLEAGAKSTLQTRAEEATGRQSARVDSHDASLSTDQNNDAVMLRQPTKTANLISQSSPSLSESAVGQGLAPLGRSVSIPKSMVRPVIHAVGFSTLQNPVDAKVE